MNDDPRTAYFAKWFATAVGSPEIVTVGTEGPHVLNLTHTLAKLGYRAPTSSTYDDHLAKMIAKFQKNERHRNVDGMFGPGTRQLITAVALDELGPDFFDKLAPTFAGFYQVFISYAWADKARVNNLDQWLRNHGIGVKRDVHDFQAGHELSKEIEKYLQLSDKAVIVYSTQSQARDWPSFERFTAENVEKHRGSSYLIYLMLDGSRPPNYDPNRLYVKTADMTLKEVGTAVIHAIRKQDSGQEQYAYDEDKPF